MRIYGGALKGHEQEPIAFKTSAGEEVFSTMCHVYDVNAPTAESEQTPGDG